MKTSINENKSNLKLKAKALDMINYLRNLSITNMQNEEDDLWVREDGSHRRYVFKASQHGEVNVFFKDILVLTYNQDCSVLASIDTRVDDLNFLVA